MKKKGLCSTCANDKECNFSRKFPVTQCEEFDGYGKATKTLKNNKKTKKGSKREKVLVHA